MKPDDEGYEVDGDWECLHETANAILVTDGEAELWVPQSQVHDNSEVYQKGAKGGLVVSTWWARKQGYLED